MDRNGVNELMTGFDIEDLVQVLHDIVDNLESLANDINYMRVAIQAEREREQENVQE